MIEQYVILLGVLVLADAVVDLLLIRRLKARVTDLEAKHD